MKPRNLITRALIAQARNRVMRDRKRAGKLVRGAKHRAIEAAATIGKYNRTDGV